MPITCARAVIERLSLHGIDTAFGIPGVHTLELYRALNNSGIRHVTARHEQGAAFMADGFARSSGRAAMCTLITGPGLLNAATAIGQAYSDSVPMVVLATVNRRADLGLGRGDLHEMRDQFSAAGGVMASVLRLHDSSQWAVAVDLAMGRLQLSRPRPGYLEMPLDIAGEEISSPALEPQTLLSRSAPNGSDLARAITLLSSAQRPLIIAGGGAVAAAGPIRSLSSRLKIPVLTTVAGKGIVPEDSSLSAGARLATDEGRQLLAQADVILAIGTELAPTDHWSGRLDYSASLIRVDIDPDVLVRDYPATVAMLSDASDTCQLINRGLSGEVRDHCWKGDLRELRDSANASLMASRDSHMATLETLRGAVARDAILVTDMTQLAYAGNQAFPAYEPRCWLHPVGFGTLGYALPAAIGAKLANPERQVVAVAGDYGFGFTGNELATAAELGLSLPVIIWNNGGLGQIQKDMDVGNMNRIGVDIAPPDFSLFARSMGCGYRKLTDISDLGDALQAGFSADAPMIIEIIVPGSIES